MHTCSVLPFPRATVLLLCCSQRRTKWRTMWSFTWCFRVPPSITVQVLGRPVPTRWRPLLLVSMWPDHFGSVLMVWSAKKSESRWQNCGHICISHILGNILFMSCLFTKNLTLTRKKCYKMVKDENQDQQKHSLLECWDLGHSTGRVENKGSHVVAVVWVQIRSSISDGRSEGKTRWYSSSREGNT